VQTQVGRHPAKGFEALTDTRRPPANDNDGPMVTMTRGELESLVSRAVGAALYLKSTEPLLVDKQDMARQLGVSPTHIDHLRKKGMPWVAVGQVVRFEPAKVIAWLKESGAA